MSIRLEPATRHYDEKLQQILKTSAKIFAEKGFHHTSVRDISRATKMSLSGLYYYFATKEELLYLIQERCFVTLLQRWEQAVGPDLDVRARIRAFAENHLSFFLHNMPEMKVMAHERRRSARRHLRSFRHDELDLHLVSAEARFGVAATDRADVAYLFFRAA